MSSDSIVIASVARTPMGGFEGDFNSVNASVLGAAAIKASVERAAIGTDDIDEVIFGCVLQAGQGQAPARQAALGAGLGMGTATATINKMCGSGMKAVMYSHDMLLADSIDVAVAGGMESMSRAPYLIDKARAGLRMGHAELQDHMFLDGLEDAYDKGRLMGTFAEDCAQAYQLSRDCQDDYAIASLERAQAAIAEGRFDTEISPVTITNRRGVTVVSIDEQPGKVCLNKIRQLYPAFRKCGSVTAANSSSISDGAAALVLMRLSQAEKRGITPLAKIVAHSSYSGQPHLFPTAPIHAMKKLSQKTGWDFKDVDLFEINEAFAVVAMAAMTELSLPHEKVNVNGGACALGHPIGASGARILVTLLAAMQDRDVQRGMASICIGGGEANAIAIELLR